MTGLSKRFFTLMGGAGVATVLWPGLIALSYTETATPVQSNGVAAHINLFQAVILGMVQGLTEFIPISSTAHLKVVPVLLGWGDPGVSFSAAIQLGSIAAVIWYFWEDLTTLGMSAFQALRIQKFDDKDLRVVLGIALGTVPIVVLGLVVKFLASEFYDNTLRSLGSIAIVSIGMGLLLGLAERIGSRKRNFDQLTLTDGVLMGMAEAMALIPGASRSGTTITAGLFMGLERGTAARFSFLLGIPAITLAGLVELKDLLESLGTAGSNTEILPLVGGLVSAVVFSYVAIAWLIRFLQTQNTWVFVWYRLGFGFLILGAISAHFLPNV
ncbi:MAG TPA: undecaprenyl-diphosphate phosphatase [Oscillatoriaceae cyanobacterium M33_DOE_052]|uniref:Undecaprenyl-diphosphatase n=1 Tax=Planktothricoides sp. SpSt-374 TaxID=2282167 RepID=A0A7C3ZNX7_9CYAN|nr:undecaprenyl-diphosphate phosphatase [Oscillatoriaceae cyanobacterium M33_DOE_052]